MSHRSACGPEPNTGDGSGILLGLPPRLLPRGSRPGRSDSSSPRRGRYGVGMILLPRDRSERTRCKSVIERSIAAQGQGFLGWRRVPGDNGDLGTGARAGEPVVQQVFVRAARGLGRDAFERRLYLIRQQADHRIRRLGLREAELYASASFSSRTIVYKGQLTPGQLPGYYADLRDPRLESHVALVHTRFSTNTFPSWSRAQPMRLLCHNGGDQHPPRQCELDARAAVPPRGPISTDRTSPISSPSSTPRPPTPGCSTTSSSCSPPPAGASPTPST